MKKSAIPVEAFYILAYLVLMSMAGTTLYFYIESQSMGPNYRISAASIIEESESIKKLIDQERLFVLETIIYFLGTQGGVQNMDEYNAYDVTTLSGNPCVTAMKNLNYNQYPSKEVITSCLNENNYDNPESLGVWKCDNYIYSYESCSGISAGSGYSYCCESADGTGHNCKESCLSALGFNLGNCQNKAYCGALWCKQNNLEIPETFQGVQYYYKIGEQEPGYYCPSLLSYNPEKDYAQGEFWEGLDTSFIINELISTANKYFYLPNPSFSGYISRVYGKNLKTAFQLNFKGCNAYSCEFSWVPNGQKTQDFQITGLGGIPMVSMGADIISTQSVNIPLTDMIEYSREIIEQKQVANYLANTLKDNVLFTSDTSINNIISESPQDWKGYFIRAENLSEGLFYDSRYCGEGNAWQTSTDYECLMQHASTRLYSAISEPMTVERASGFSYSLRPVFNFVLTSMGASAQKNELPKNIQLGKGQYSIFVKGVGPANGTIKLLGNEYYFNIASDEDYAQAKRFSDELGRCSYNEYLPEQPLDYYQEFGCCPIDSYENGECTVSITANSYCTSINNRYGRSQIGAYCFVSTSGESANVFSTQIQSSSGGHSSYWSGIITPSNTDKTLTSFKVSTVASNEGKTDGIILQANSGKKINYGEKWVYSAYVWVPTGTNVISRMRAYTGGGYQSSTAITIIGNNDWQYIEKIFEAGENVQQALELVESSDYSTSRTFYIRGASLKPLIGSVDYDINTFTLASSQEVYVELKDAKGTIEDIEIVRANYDKTYPMVSRTINGQLMNFGGSLEYYDSQKNDCQSAVGESQALYGSFNNNELWYSMLCLRSKGNTWTEINEKYPALFDNFQSKLGNTDGRQKLDNFIKTYKITITNTESIPKVSYSKTGCSPNCVTQLSTNPQILWIDTINERFNALADNELIIERLKEIQLNTSQLSLPVKWVFAYNDKVSVDSTNLGDNSGCDLDYTPSKTYAPDCGCKTNCYEEAMCYFDFSELSKEELRAGLYNYDDIFVYNAGYKTSKVVE